MTELSRLARTVKVWETEILPARIAEYEPSWLDDQCLAGRIAWAWLSDQIGRMNERPEYAPNRSVQSETEMARSETKTAISETHLKRSET